MTHDQVREMVRRINPIPDPSVLEVGSPPVLELERDLRVDERPTVDEHRSHRWRGAAIGLAAAGVVMIAGLVYVSTDREPVAEPAPGLETMTDLEVIEAGVAAVYSGEGDRAAELFELAALTDGEIRAEAAYQGAIGGRLTMTCTEGEGGVFGCTHRYENALTDAIDDRIGEDLTPVVVEEGVITQFEFPEHTFIVRQMGTFLAMEGRLEAYEGCTVGPFPESCAMIQLENLDSWVEWRQTLSPADLVEFGVESWYEGDCEAARFVAGFETDVCSTQDTLTQTAEYESILGADVSVEGCGEPVPADPDAVTISCEVHYSNVLSSAVGKASSVTTREFRVEPAYGLIGMPNSFDPWYLVDYPEDTELRESFGLFAEGGELADEYAAAECADTRSPECASLMVDYIDDWAVWYETSN